MIRTVNIPIPHVRCLFKVWYFVCLQGETTEATKLFLECVWKVDTAWISWCTWFSCYLANSRLGWSLCNGQTNQPYPSDLFRYFTHLRNPLDTFYRKCVDLDGTVQASPMEWWMTDWRNMRGALRCVDRLGHDLPAIIILPTSPAIACRLPILPTDCPHIAHIVN